MSKNQQELSQFLKNIRSGLKHCTIAELNTAITKVLSAKKRIPNTDEVNHIIAVCCDHFNISRRKIMAKHSGTEAKVAREIAMCLIYTRTGLNQRIMADYFGVSPRIVNISIRKEKTIDVNIKWDKEFNDHHKAIKTKLDNYEKSQNN